MADRIVMGTDRPILLTPAPSFVLIVAIAWFGSSRYDVKDIDHIGDSCDITGRLREHVVLQ